jgi:hypothetical protein
LTGPSFTGTNWNILTGVFNGASSKICVNNGAYTTGDAGSNGPSTNLAIGTNGGLASEWFNGDIACALHLKGACTDADRTMYHQILSVAYGITIS